MLQQLVKNDTVDIANVIQLAHWKLKPKMEPIEQSLEGKLTDHHRFLIKASLEHMRFIEEQLKRLDEEIQRRLQPYQEEYALLQTIPGIKETGANSGRDWSRHVAVSRRGPPLVMGRRVSWKQ
jgi:transposase